MLVSEKPEDLEIIEPDIENFFKENQISDDFKSIFLKFEPQTNPEESENLSEEQKNPSMAATTPFLSKKKLKKLNRPSVFELKQKIKRPEVVE